MHRAGVVKGDEEEVVGSRNRDETAIALVYKTEN